MELPQIQAHPEAQDLRRVMASCVLIGIVAGLGAAAFFVMLEAGSAFCMGYLAGYHPNGPGYETPLFDSESGDGQSIIRWVLLIIPAVGGLISGLITFSLAPEAEGHGTDAAIEAYHFKDGVVRARVPFIKAITSAITIGSGGSGGREGPIAQIGAGFGSILGGWLKMPPDERRILMAAGMAAGIGAIFHAPLAGALFAAEVMYQGPDQEHEVFVPAFVTSIVSYCVFGAFFGFHPLFVTPAYHISQPLQLLPYFILAVVCALGAKLFVSSFYGARHLMFDRLKLPNHVKPALGGIVVGIIGFFLPEAIGAGYGVVQACFNNDVGVSPAIIDLPSAGAIRDFLPGGMAPAFVGAALLAIIAVAKIGTTSFSIGSGGSGGVFGPAVVIGGALGGATGLLCAELFPAWQVEPGAFALVGMAGFFAGAANTPISTIIMVSEMTGNYNLLLPAMLVCIVSYMLCQKFTLYERQLPSRLDAPSKVGNMARAILQRLTVRLALSMKPDRSLMVVPVDMVFSELVDRFASSTHECFPVVDGEGCLVGVIDTDQIRQLVTEIAFSDAVIAGDIAESVQAVSPNESLLVAVNLMVSTGRHELIVVDEQDSRRAIDTLSRSDVITAYNRQIASPKQ